MKEKVRFLGLDVHAETIAVAVAEQDGEVRSLGAIANREESIRKLVKKLGPVEQLRACYEAGPTGYVLYWQLTQLGVECAVVAPTLVPVKAGDRVKTDRRDAEKLARNHRSDDLTAVWVPDEGSEALRDLVRAREAAKQDQLRARHRLSKFLLRTGRRPAMGLKAWTERYLAWVQQVHFSQPAQEFTLLDYLHEGQHMDERVHTKTGNAHLRRIAVESAWSYRFRPAIGPRLRQRQEGVPEEIKEIAWKAQIRLHKRYLKLMAAGKDKQKIITAVGRELLWASSGPSGSKRKWPASSRWRHDERQFNKSKNFSKKEKTKTIQKMNNNKTTPQISQPLTGHSISGKGCRPIQSRVGTRGGKRHKPSQMKVS
jgi:transposase